MTIEQLEAEGWLKVAAVETYFVAASKQIDNRWIELGYNVPTQQLQVLKAYQHPAGFKTRETIYNGKCPDLEIFKQLIGLLEIKTYTE